jgi:hypothetical protein
MYSTVKRKSMHKCDSKGDRWTIYMHQNQMEAKLVADGVAPWHKFASQVPQNVTTG